MASASLLSLRSEEHTSELQSRLHLVCRLLLEKKKKFRLRSLRRRKIAPELLDISLFPFKAHSPYREFHAPHFLFFFFNDTATTEIYTLSLHDALPISPLRSASARHDRIPCGLSAWRRDRKSTRLNSSHGYISYAVFCLKKKKTNF